MGETTLARDARPGVEAGAGIARLYERHGRALYGLCLMLLRDPHDAEDALQSAFLAAHGALVRGGVPRDEGAWLATIVRNECRGRVRMRMESPVHDGPGALDAIPDPQPAPDERLSDPEVGRALSALSEKQREAVVLHDVLGLRSREVGVALGVSLPAVEALLFRARRQLRLRLRPAGILVVPAALGQALAQAIPGFVAPAAAAGLAGTAGGAAGAGLLAKLAAAPTAAKVAAGVAAAATAGSVTAVEATNDPPSRTPAVPAISVPAGDTDDHGGSDDGDSSGSDADRSGRDDDDDSGPGSGDADDNEGRGAGGESDDERSSGKGSGRDEAESDDSGRDDPDAGDHSGRGGASVADADEPEADEPEPEDDASRSGTGDDPDDDVSRSGPGGGADANADDDSSGHGSGESPDDAD